MKKILMYSMALLLMFSTVCTGVFADTEKERDAVREKLSSEGVWLTPEESTKQKVELDSLLDSLDNQADRRSESYTYDIENDPLPIEKKNECDPGYPYFYARHTLGTYNSSTQYLTSYGQASINKATYNALPYRNGAGTVEANKVVDVAMGIYFSIRDLGTDIAADVYRNDIGPNQCPKYDGGKTYLRQRIADLEPDVWKKLHDTTSTKDGVFDCRTYVKLSNYFPGD